MSQFKNMNNNKLLYTYTDSIFMANPISEELIGPGLGKFKL